MKNRKTLDIINIKDRDDYMWEYILIKLGIKKESLAERANRRLMSGIEPSEYAKRIHISGKKYNEMMERAVIKYNKTHERKLFVE